MAQQQLKNWMFTSYKCDGTVDGGHFNVPDNDKDFRMCVWQYEYCPDTGKLHAQGYIEFKNSKRLNKVKELLEDPAVHLEKRNGTKIQAITYCSKRESRVDGTEPFFIGDVPKQGSRTDLLLAKKKIQEHKSLQDIWNDGDLVTVCARYSNWVEKTYRYKPIGLPPPDIQLRAWQHKLLSILAKPVKKRQVVWIWSSESGTGKTTMFDYVASLKEHKVLAANGDFANILYAYDGHTVLWFDLTRSQTVEHVPWHSLEKFSNQTVHLSTKYICCQKYVSAHVVVTANIPPEEQRLPGRFVEIKAELNILDAVTNPQAVTFTQVITPPPRISPAPHSPNIMDSSNSETESVDLAEARNSELRDFPPENSPEEDPFEIINAMDLDYVEENS